MSELSTAQKQAMVGYYSTLASVPGYQKALTQIGRASKPDAYKAYVKPVQPDYGMQFEGITGDITVNRDRWFNEIPVDKTSHSVPAGDAGRFGTHYAEFQSGDNDGYGVEIPHGQGAAFNNVETVYVDNSRADRGKDQ